MTAKEIFRLLPVLLLGMAATAGEMVWQGAKLADWKARRNVRCVWDKENSSLVLSEIKADSQLLCDQLAFDPSEFDTFVFRYRAEGTTGSGGQLYYVHESEKNRFHDRQKWKLPRLVADGKWHEVAVSSANLVNPKSWSDSGPIVQLRFDPTDGAGGRIEISEIRLRNSKDLPPTVRWDGRNRFSGWEAQRNVEIDQNNGILLLTGVGRDAQLVNRKVNIDPEKYTTFVYTYRAKDTGNLGGQLFYASEQRRIDGANYWKLPPLKADGEWHTVRVSIDSQKCMEHWRGAGRITMLRFDPTDSAGGTIELKEIFFESEAKSARLRFPPPPLRWTLDAPVWPAVKPEFRKPSASRVKGNYFQGRMIASEEDKGSANKDSAVFFLRKAFDLKAVPEQAFVQFVGDDGAVLWVNGVEAGRNSNWKQTSVAEVSDLLRAGRNVLGFQYENHAHAGGVFGELTAVYPDGSVERVHTDASFRAAAQAPANWAAVEFDDSRWAEAVSLPGPPQYPYLVRISYQDFAMPQALLKKTAAPEVVTAGEKTRLIFEFSGKQPALPLYATLRLTEQGSLVWEEELEFGASEVKAADKDHWTLEFDYRIPLYLNSRKVKLKLESGAYYCRRGGAAEVDLSIRRAAVIPGFERPVTSRVKTVPGYGTILEVNGNSIFPVWGGVRYINRPDKRPVLCDAKLNLVTVHASSSDWFPAVDRFDPTAFDRVAELYRRSNPDSYFVWDITMRIPRDFTSKHPEDLCRDNTGEVTRDGSHPNYTYASEAAYGYMRDAMLKALQYLENAPYANRIVGYRINGGHTIEWLGWDPLRGRVTDFSETARRAFARFARKHYPELQDRTVPTLEERQMPDGELLWDQKEHLKSIAFHEFYSDSIAEVIIRLCSEAKKYLNNRKVLSTYFGYVMTLPASGRSQMRAHYALKKLLNARVVDLILSPQPYRVRNIGDAYGDMKPFATLINHGIMPIIEDDTRTFNGPGGLGYFQMPTRETTIQVMRRNLGFTLCRNLGGLYYALTAGTEYHYPEFARDLDKFRLVGEHNLKRRVNRGAKVAAVVSEKSVIGMPMIKSGIYSGELMQSYLPDGTVRSSRRGGAPVMHALEENYTKLARTGAAVDYVLAEDLAEHPGDYDVYVFLNVFQYDDALLSAVEKLRQRPCTLLWVYAPGYHHQFSGNVENMRKLTGFEFEKLPKPVTPAVKLADGRWIGTVAGRIKPMFAVKNKEAEVLGVYENGAAGFAAMPTGQAVSIFLGAYQFDCTVLRELFRKAGVHIYSASDDPVEANGSLICVHSRTPGRKNIKLPRRTDVVDVFNAVAVASDVSEFTYDATLHDTRLFYYGDDADALLKKLEERK